MLRLRFGSTNPFETDKRIPHRRIAHAMAPRRCAYEAKERVPTSFFEGHEPMEGSQEGKGPD